MALDDKTVKIVLDERDLPTHWYNVVPGLPSPPPPPLHPGTGQPLGPADLAPLFPMGIILQEVSQEPMPASATRRCATHRGRAGPTKTWPRWRDHTATTCRRTSLSSS
jgi:predicted alternative tryptophan synthase beta-subunit